MALSKEEILDAISDMSVMDMVDLKQSIRTKIKGNHLEYKTLNHNKTVNNLQ